MITIDAAHAGFPRIAHGGYVCGLVAGALGGDGVAVSFLRPVPIGQPVDVRVDGDGARLVRGDELLVKGERAGPLEVDVPPPPALAEAVAASAAYPGHRHHPFPTCFCCGPANDSGLHVFATQVPGRLPGYLAAPWTPAGEPGSPVPLTSIWGALDCPAIWALMVAAPEHSAARVVTGRLHGHLLGEVRAGEPHVVTAWPAGGGGGKQLAVAALHDREGRTLAVMRQTCVEVTGWGVPLGRAVWGRGG